MAKTITGRTSKMLRYYCYSYYRYYYRIVNCYYVIFIILIKKHLIEQHEILVRAYESL